MLSHFDDYPIHQTPEPIAQPASSDRNVYDRYWFNGYARDGEFYFAIGLGMKRSRNCGPVCVTSKRNFTTGTGSATRCAGNLRK